MDLVGTANNCLKIGYTTLKITYSILKGGYLGALRRNCILKGS